MFERISSTLARKNNVFDQNIFTIEKHICAPTQLLLQIKNRTCLAIKICSREIEILSNRNFQKIITSLKETSICSYLLNKSPRNL